MIFGDKIGDVARGRVMNGFVLLLLYRIYIAPTVYAALYNIREDIIVTIQFNTGMYYFNKAAHFI